MGQGTLNERFVLDQGVYPSPVNEGRGDNKRGPPCVRSDRGRKQKGEEGSVRVVEKGKEGWAFVRLATTHHAHTQAVPQGHREGMSVTSHLLPPLFTYLILGFGERVRTRERIPA